MRLIADWNKACRNDGGGTAEVGRRRAASPAINGLFPAPAVVHRFLDNLGDRLDQDKHQRQPRIIIADREYAEHATEMYR